MKIKDFALVKTGGTPSTRKAEFWENGDIPWLNSGELNQGYVRTTRNYITALGLENSAAKLLPKDTVLIALTGSTTGVVGYLEFEACANQSVTGILPSDNHHPKYLYYYLRSIRPRIVADAYGGAQPHISQAYVKELDIPLPPLDQQKKIAAILDAADAYRQKTKALIDKYDQLSQSLFLEMFGDPDSNTHGWDVMPFEHFIVFDTNMTSDFEKFGDLPHLGISNIAKDSGIIIDCKTAREEGLTSGKYLFDSRHVIYSKIRPNLNKVALPNFKGLCSADAYPLLPVEGVSNRYFIAYLLRSEHFMSFILKHSNRTNIPKANKKQMQSYNGICPPYNLQKRFEESLSEIEAQKNLALSALDKAENLFNSLLQKAFKGELTA